MNDEQIVLTLPATQSVDAIYLTPQESSQEKTTTVWGRLCPIKLPFKTMGKNIYLFNSMYYVQVYIIYNI